MPLQSLSEIGSFLRRTLEGFDVEKGDSIRVRTEPGGAVFGFPLELEADDPLRVALGELGRRWSRVNAATLQGAGRIRCELLLKGKAVAGCSKSEGYLLDREEPQGGDVHGGDATAQVIRAQGLAAMVPAQVELLDGEGGNGSAGAIAAMTIAATTRDSAVAQAAMAADRDGMRTLAGALTDVVSQVTAISMTDRDTVIRLAETNAALALRCGELERDKAVLEAKLSLQGEGPASEKIQLVREVSTIFTGVRTKGVADKVRNADPDKRMELAKEKAPELLGGLLDALTTGQGLELMAAIFTDLVAQLGGQEAIDNLVTFAESTFQACKIKAAAVAKEAEKKAAKDAGAS